jgi:hypothetical protein
MSYVTWDGLNTLVPTQSGNMLGRKNRETVGAARDKKGSRLSE